MLDGLFEGKQKERQKKSILHLYEMAWKIPEL